MTSAGATSAGGDISESAKTHLSETLQNPKTIQALCIESEMTEVYIANADPCADMTSRQKFKARLISSLIFGLTNAILQYIVALNFWFTAFLMNEEYATYEDTNMALMSMLYAAIGAG